MIDVKVTKSKKNPGTKDLMGIISPVGYDKLKKAEFGDKILLDIRITDGYNIESSKKVFLEKEYEALKVRNIELSEITSMFIHGEKIDSNNRICEVGSILAIEGRKVG